MGCMFKNDCQHKEISDSNSYMNIWLQNRQTHSYAAAPSSFGGDFANAILFHGEEKKNVKVCFCFDMEALYFA